MFFLVKFLVVGTLCVCKTWLYILINQKWYDDKRSDIAEESNRIVAAAAKLIKSEIREFEYSNHFYPPSKEVSSVDSLKE